VGGTLLVGLGQATLGFPAAPGGALAGAIVVIALTLPIAAFALCAAGRRGQGWGWVLIGAGLILNSAGEAYFYFVQRTLTAFPTAGDFLCLGLFPFMIAGIVLLVHGGRDRRGPSIGTDGLVIALAVGALTYELIFQALLGGANGSWKLADGQLAYPALDLGTLIVLAVVCIPSRFRVDAAYLWLMAGIAVLLVTDVANLQQTARGVTAPGLALYFGWAIAIVLLSASSRSDARLTSSDAFRGSPLRLALGGAILLALGVLLYDAMHDRNPVVTAASGSALLLGLVRLFRTLTENNRLLGERDEVIAKQRRMQSQLRFQADHDSLTGLHNRRRFAERADEQIRLCRRYGRTAALLFVDLDSFKFVNDSFGHPAGDRVLRDVAEAIATSVRSTDVVGRLGGDEFAVLLPEADEAGAVQTAETLIAAVRSHRDPTIGASVGVVLFGSGGERTVEDLFVAADLALYEAKDAGNGGIRVFKGQGGHRLAWVDRIRAALAEKRLALSAQPIVDLKTGDTVREELLVRMLDRDGNEIPPDAFLPTAERFGLIADIDRFAVERGIDLARGGRAVAVNVSGPSMTDRTLVDTVAAAVHRGLDPHMLSFELTETSGVSNIETARRFAGYLEALGCELALDDFGTGFSSLSYLNHLPVQTLKIDTEFVRGVGHGAFDRYLVRMIVNLAHRLNQKTVAEGIEDEATLSMVRELEVDYGQGFLLGAPEPIEPPGESPARKRRATIGKSAACATLRRP